MNDRFFLAPVKGITDLTYRNCFARNFSGVDSALIPFADTVKGHLLKPSKTADYDPAMNRMDIIPQIIGKDPLTLCSIAEQLRMLGNREINLNLGCPHPLRTRKKTGSGLLPYPEDIDLLLKALFQHCDVEISIKTRLGMETSTELFELIPVLNRYPIKKVFIHPRTAAQGYTGSPDLEAFRKCASRLVHPVGYNGDIISTDSFQSLKAGLPGICSWMIGRGLLRDPFLVEKIKSGVKMDHTQVVSGISRFHDQLLMGYSQQLSGFSHVLHKMAGHWEYLITYVHDPAHFRSKLGKIRSIEQYHDLVRSALGPA